MPETAPVPMTLSLARKDEIAQGIYLFELRDPGSGELPPFTAGAHVAITVPNGLVRKYSLCNDPRERDRYLVAVKREAPGRGGSVSLIEDGKVGDTMKVTAPVNDFRLPPRGEHFIFIAGGIGITPMMAMIHELRAAQGKHFKLFYCSRTPEMTAFREELSVPELKDSVVIHYDQGDPARSIDLRPFVKERKNREHLYCCGPRPLMEAVRAMTAHWTPSSVHFEAFSDDSHKAGDTAFTVKLARTGEVINVPADQTILQALRLSGHDVPSSCEGGTCGTCRAKLIEGEVDHRDLFLGEQQRADNIMICVSRARSPQLVIDREGLK